MRDLGEPFHSPEGGFTGATRALALRCPRTAVASIVLGGARIRDSDDASVRIVPFRKIANLAHSHTRSASACVADVRMAIASSSPVPLCIRTYAESVGLLGRSEGARVPAHLLPGYPIPLLFTPRSSCNDRPHVPCRAGSARHRASSSHRGERARNSQTASAEVPAPRGTRRIRRPLLMRWAVGLLASD